VLRCAFFVRKISASGAYPLFLSGAGPPPGAIDAGAYRRVLYRAMREDLEGRDGGSRAADRLLAALAAGLARVVAPVRPPPKAPNVRGPRVSLFRSRTPLLPGRWEAVWVPLSSLAAATPPPYRGSAGRARGGGRGAGAGVPGALPGDRRGRRPTRPHRRAPAPPQHMTGAQCFTTARVCARAQLSPAGV